MRLAITILSMLPGPVAALELTYQTSYELNRPARLGLNPLLTEAQHRCSPTAMTPKGSPFGPVPTNFSSRSIVGPALHRSTTNQRSQPGQPHCQLAPTA